MSLPPYTQTLSAEDAAHFLRRTAFGATDAQIEALSGQDARAVAKDALSFGMAMAPNNPFDPANGATPGDMIQLTRGAWMYELLYGPAPLREKLVLTWSNHFVVGTDKVRNEPSLRGYLKLLREQAATRQFADFAVQVARSPAMLRYLDNDQNRKGRPNENFSRELLELFTTGIGHYTEQDVHEGARALSGWTFTGGRGNKAYLEEPQFVFNAGQHDAGRKTYLGKSGNFGPEDIVRMAATHPATATFVCHKLHRAFVTDTPDLATVEGSAETFRRTGGDIRAVLEELIASRVFYASRQSIIRGPVEYIAGMVRTLGQPPLEAKAVLNLAQTAGKMGQTLLQPDTVKGWDGGREWINDTTLLLRMQVAAALTLGKNAPAPEPPSPLALLGGQLPVQSALSGLDARHRLYLMLISPEFQLV